MAEGTRGAISPNGSSRPDARRVRAWTALARLFLDTEHSHDVLAAIAHQLRETGYSLEQLETMLRCEIAPVFGGNLLSVAGEWSSWDEAEVARIMARDLPAKGRPGLLRRAIGALSRPLASREWRAIRQLLAADGANQS